MMFNQAITGFSLGEKKQPTNQKKKKNQKKSKKTPTDRMSQFLLIEIAAWNPTNMQFYQQHQSWNAEEHCWQ